MINTEQFVKENRIFKDQIYLESLAICFTWKKNVRFLLAQTAELKYSIRKKETNDPTPRAKNIP